MSSLRHAATFRRLLAVLLILQAVLAPSLCLARAAGGPGLGVEICTADGLRLVHLEADGREAPSGGTVHDGGCLACHALPQAVAVPVPALPVPAWIVLGAAWVPTGPAAPPPAIRGPPFGPRAPPSLLS